MNPVWRMPIFLAVTSTLGLAAAIAGDGVWDILSWLGLGIPAALSVWRLRTSWRKFADQRQG